MRFEAEFVLTRSDPTGDGPHDVERMRERNLSTLSSEHLAVTRAGRQREHTASITQHSEKSRRMLRQKAGNGPRYQLARAQEMNKDGSQARIQSAGNAPQKSCTKLERKKTR